MSAGIAGIIALRDSEVDPSWIDLLAERIDRRSHSWNSRACSLAHLGDSDLGDSDVGPPGAEGVLRAVFAGWLAEPEHVAAQIGDGAFEGDAAALLLRAYRRWGDTACERLEGEFVAAIFDEASRALWLMQSPMAGRPLFYARSPEFVAFAPRAAALAGLPWVGVALDEEGVARALGRASLRMADGARTCFRGVQRCLPGTMIRATGAGAWTERTFWNPRPDPQSARATREEAHEVLKQRLEQAVARRIRGHNRVACMLSGGLDSSSLTALAVRMKSADRVFAVASVFPGGPDESPFIAEVGRHLGINVIPVTPPDDYDVFWPTDAAHRCEQPIPVYHYLYRSLNEAAREHGASVVLDGVFGELSVSRPWFPLRQWVAARVRPALRQSWATSGRGFSHEAYERFHVCLRSSFVKSTRHLSMWRLWDLPPIGRCAGMPRAWRKAALSETFGEVPGVRAEFPYRDPDIWRYVAGLPRSFLRQDGRERHLIRACMVGMLPESIRLRTSKGPFSPDYQKRLRRTAAANADRVRNLDRNGLAATYLDLPWLVAALERLATLPENALPLREQYFVQLSVQAAGFFCWLEKLR